MSWYLEFLNLANHRQEYSNQRFVYLDSSSMECSKHDSTSTSINNEQGLLAVSTKDKIDPEFLAWLVSCSKTMSLTQTFAWRHVGYWKSANQMHLSCTADDQLFPPKNHRSTLESTHFGVIFDVSVILIGFYAIIFEENQSLVSEKYETDELGDEVEGDLAEACATFWTKDLP